MNFALPGLEPLNFEVNRRRYSLSLQPLSNDDTSSVQLRKRSYSVGDRINKAINSLNSVLSRGSNNLNSPPNKVESNMDTKQDFSSQGVGETISNFIFVDNISPINEDLSLIHI